MEQTEAEKLQEVFNLLGIDSDKKETDSSDWITTLGNLRKVEDLLKDIHDDISEEARERITKRVLAVESACYNILQVLPQHRATRGRTGEATPGRKTESGYDSTRSSASSQVLSVSSAVLSIHERPEKTFEQPTPNGSSVFAPTNGTNGGKRVVKALKQETTVENKTDAAASFSLEQDATLENQTDAASSRNPVENEETL